jgi:RHS repeat-associated protein
VDFIKEKGTIYIPGIYAQDKFFVLDLNGDGISQLYRRFSSPSSGGPGFSSIRYPDGLNTWFVKEIQNGIGEKIEVKYSNLSEPDDVYTLGSGANFPVKDVTPSLFVVSDVIYSNGGSSDITSKYYYSGAKIHSKGKGFLGFMSTKRKNMTTGIVSESNNILNTRYYTLVPQSSETRYGTSNKISGTTSDITLVYTGNKRFWTRTNSITKTDHLKNTSVKQAFTNYYEYGNPGTIKTEFFSGGANSGISTEKVITYTGKDGGSWCDNKPQTVTTTKTNENGSQTRTTEYDYFDNGNLKSKTQDPDKAEEVKTVFDDYDDFGNPGLKSTVTNSGTHTTIFDYSDSGVFLEREEDKASGFSSSYNFDDTNGLLMSETDHLGLTTKYEYDGFGRQTKATYPDGTYSVKSLQWAGGEGRGGAVYYSYEESSGQSPVWTWYDGQGRELRKEYYGFKDDKKIWVDTDYYSETGRLESVSKPYFAEGSKEPAESYTYDDEGRMLTKKTPMGTTTMAYDGLTTTITSPRSVKVKTVNAAGQTVSSTVDGRSVTFYYYPSGKVKESTPQGGKAVEMAYDLRGNRTKITDPDAGIVENTYNGFGEVLSEKYIMGSGEDERTVTTSYTYDESGRLEKEDRNGTITNYKYNGSNGFLESVKNPDHELTYVYDEGSDKSLGRPTSINEKIDGNTFTSRTTYDAFGREQKHTYPSGFYVRNTYTKYSHLEEVKGSNGKSIWKGEVANALGQFKKIKKGGKTTTFGYDEKDRVESIYLPDIIDHFYKFNDKGNLKSREDRLTSHKEIFTYEKHQLKTWKIEQNGNVASTFSMDYDEHGNITGKSDLGYEMQYNDERPHAISGIKGNPSLISDQEQIITYTDFKKIATVTEGDHNLTLTYGIDDQRRKGVFKTNNEITLTRYYLGDYEEEQTPDGKKRKIHYLSGGDGLSAIYVEEDGNSNFYYAYTDYLGSLTVLTDKDGNVEERQAFDPWGNRREPSDWTSLITTPVSNITGRGYTMHEHLDGFALINMNGRVYDPQIARFLSPDPQLQAPGYWLNYNRYGYCYNNPFIYTDPSGEFIFTLLASVIPGAQFLLPLAVSTDIGWMQGGMRASMQGQSFWSGAWKGGVVGAVGGGLGMIGGAGMPFVQNLLLGTGQGALVGGLDAALWGNDIGNGMLWGAAGGAVFTTLTSENFSNSLKGEGFYTNENVFNNMMKRGMGEQAILNYFGFDGTYTGTTKGPGYVNGGGKGTSFFGSTDPQTGNIKYGDLAFDSYEKLKMTYNKEMYHSLRVKNGIPLESQGTAFGKHLKYYPEERLGFIHAYKNQGLYPSAGKGLMGNISFYQSQSFNLNPSQYYSAKWWHFVYKIPRRW